MTSVSTIDKFFVRMGPNYSAKFTVQLFKAIVTAPNW